MYVYLTVSVSPKADAEPIHSRHQNAGGADRHPTGNKTPENAVINKRI
jgi:hypothetical protein